MQEYHDYWSKMYQSATKPLLQLAQLNIETLNNIMRNSLSFEEWSQIKKPEDLFNAQMKAANSTFVETSKYSQRAMEIAQSAISNTAKLYSETMNQTSNKVSEFTKHAGKHEKTS